MYKIRNLTNSPYDLIDADGNKVRIEAHGEVTTSLHPLHEGLYRAIKYLTLEEVSNDPLDHDGDGRKGGSVEADIEEWRKLYEVEKGDAPDGRWKVARIQKELGL